MLAVALAVAANAAQAQVGAWRTLTMKTSQSISGTFHDMGATRAIDHTDKAVTYYETMVGGQTQGHFVLNKDGTRYFIVDLPSDIVVSDFETDAPNEALFFCGKRMVGDQTNGVYGQVSFRTGVSSADFWCLDVTEVACLDKMVLFKDGLVHFVFATAEGLSHESRIFFSMSLSLSAGYSIGATHWVMDVRPEEHLYDVALTDDYVVFMGHEADHHGLSLRRFLRSNPMNTEKDRVYCFALPPEDMLSTPVLADLRTTLAVNGENDLAVAYMTQTNSGVYGSRVRVFDVATMTNTQTQCYMMREKMDVREMAYAGSAKKLALLQDGNPRAGSAAERSVVCLMPYLGVPYNADVLTWNGVRFASVDAIPENAASTRHVVLGHHDMGHVVWTLKNVGASDVASGCHLTDGVAVRIEANLSRVEIADPLQDTPVDDMTFIYQVSKTSDNINHYCLEQ